MLEASLNPNQTARENKLTGLNASEIRVSFWMLSQRKTDMVILHAFRWSHGQTLKMLRTIWYCLQELFVDGHWLYLRLWWPSVRPSTPFSADTDTLIFCCQPNTIPTDTLQYRTWRRVGDRSKAADAATATNNNGGGADRLQRGGGCLWSVVDSQTQQLSVKFNMKNSSDNANHTLEFYSRPTLSHWVASLHVYHFVSSQFFKSITHCLVTY